MQKNEKKQFKILKASGYPEPFSKNKLIKSLQRTGLPRKECEHICDEVLSQISEGTKSSDIFNKTLKLVKQTSPIASIHYSLKKSLFELGPEGHHFENFVSKYFEEIGYRTEIRKLLRGKFVQHEVDVIAEIKEKQHFIECKFHNHAGLKNDVKVSLYVKARWDDLRQGLDGKKLKNFYIASNTAFTEDAITYANGTGLFLLGINMPSEDSFLDEIKKLKLYPVTSLRYLPRTFKNNFLHRGIVLARDVLFQKEQLIKQGMKQEDINILMKEIEMLTQRNSWK